jgi:hypothetical protein
MLSREQAAKDDADAADDESDSDIGSDDGQVTTYQQKKHVPLLRKRQIRNKQYEMQLPYIYTCIHLFAKKYNKPHIVIEIELDGHKNEANCSLQSCGR